MTRARPCDRVGRMNDATERLDERGRRSFERRSDLYCIHCRHCNELREPAWQTGDAMLAIELTLVTILRAAIFTQDFAAAADAIQALVDHDAIAFTQIVDRTTDLLNDARDLVSENLRL